AEVCGPAPGNRPVLLPAPRCARAPPAAQQHRQAPAGGPEVSGGDASEVSVTAVGAVSVTIDAEHPALAGHFPGAPILPRVLLLDGMLRAVEQEHAPAGTRWRIGAAKFVKPVRP